MRDQDDIKQLEKSAKQNRPLFPKGINGLFCFIVLTLIGIPACQKDTVELIWLEQKSNTNFTLSAIHFEDENHGYAIGGDTWYNGISLETQDGGQTWQADSLGNKQLFDLHFDEEGIGYTTGIDGYVYKKEIDMDWSFHRFPSWDIMRAICFYDQDNGITVGGEAYKTGVIQHFTNSFKVDTTILTDYELSDVCYSDATTVHAVGYGVVLRSEDGGYHWELKSIDGDFFRAIHFPTSTTGYAIGSAGTIIKTIDAGLTWEKIRNGENILVKDIFFRSIYFVDENKGYIVGNKGTFWQTDNGGVDWKINTQLPTDIDFHDVFATEKKGWIVGTKGKIYHFEE